MLLFSLINIFSLSVHFLRQLQDLQFMWKPLHQEGNPCNSSNDLAEWTEILSHIDDIEINNQANVELDSEALFMYKTSEFFNELKETTCSLDE